MMTFIRFLWPFLKEMILGDRSLKEAIKHHKWRVLLLGTVILSIVLNFLTIPRLLSLAHDHVELKRKYVTLVKQRWPNADISVEPPWEAPQPSQAEAPAEEPKTSSELEHSVEQLRGSQEFFKRLQQQEQRGR